MQTNSLKVGEVAEQAGVGVQTLHYYERLGLLPKPGRSAANYRLYSPEAVRRVRFIKKAQALGLNLQEIKEVLELKDRRKAPCGRVPALAERRFEEIDRQIAELRAFPARAGEGAPEMARGNSRGTGLRGRVLRYDRAPAIARRVFSKKSVDPLSR